MTGTLVVDPATVRDLSPDVLDPAGRLQILPAAFWAGTTVEERALFGHRSGIYSYPTTELVEHLRGVIAGRSAIEIGAGNGVLAAALGIKATDSWQQTKEPYRSHYRRLGHTIVPYGSNVIDCDAYHAVRRYKPDVVIGCWVTHKYDPARHEADGNEVGIDEVDVLANCSTYVVVGNEAVHAGKVLWSLAHDIVYPEYVYSRATNGSRGFIATWGAGHGC